MNRNIDRMIKMSIAFVAAMLIAMLLKVPYSFTAGLYGLMFLDTTRKNFVIGGYKKIVGTFLGLVLAILIFTVFGYDLWVFLLCCALYIPLTFLFKVQPAIIATLVAISQIQGNQSLYFAINSLYLMLIGLIVALLLSLYMPKDKKILEKISLMDSHMNDLVQKIANNDIVLFNQIMGELNALESTIKIELDNAQSQELENQLKYVEMRREQIWVLKRIQTILNGAADSVEKEVIQDLLKEFDSNIAFDNYAKHLDDKLQELIEIYKSTDLPQNHEEFEERAQLYYALMEIDKFLNIKLVFHQTVGFLKS